MPRTENAGEGEREVEEDDLATAFYDAEQIDLMHLIMEQFQLAVPMKALCTEACKGLCTHCGTNLNTGSCDCNVKWEDPRLAALEGDEADRLTTFYVSTFHFLLSEVQTMPNPKRRHSKSRTAKRRTHDTLVATQSSDCPNCREPKPPHRACPHCGYYRGRQVRAVDEA